MKRLCSTLVLLTALIAVAPAQNFFNQADVQWLAVPDRADWTYAVGDTATIDVQVLRYGMPQDGVEIAYAVGGDCLDPDARGTVTTRGGHALIPVGTAAEPGFRDCRMECVVGGKTFRNHLKVGFSPDSIRPFTQEPADFDAYWQGVLDAQAREVPLHAVVTPEPRFTTDRVDCWLVKLRCYRTGEHYIYGYLTAPKGVLVLDAASPAPVLTATSSPFRLGAEGRRCPVLVSPPGAGVKPMDPLKTLFYAEQGIIRLDLEIHGIDPALPADVYRDITRAFGEHHAGGYLASGIASRDTYYMRKVYASLVRAVDLLVALPAWDGLSVLVQGNSQGAALATVLAALDPRVTAIAVAHPALTDMAAYAAPGRTGGYPHFGRKYKDIALTPDVVRTLAYYDVINFARRVRCPVFLTYGYNDNTCPPTTSAAYYNVLTCPKERIVTPINEHWISTDMRHVQLDFLRRQCR